MSLKPARSAAFAQNMQEWGEQQMWLPHQNPVPDDIEDSTSHKRTATSKEMDGASSVQFSDTPDVDFLTATYMYNMVSDAPNGGKLCFLKNSQAKLIAESKDALRRLVSAFDIKPPNMVIHFLGSPGSVEGLRSFSSFKDGNCVESVFPQERWLAGVCQHRLPFTGDFKEQAAWAEDKLCTFLENVLLPLACETQALVVCDCTMGWCQLAQLFNQVVRLKMPAGELPFTILGITCEVPDYYGGNPDYGAYWRRAQRHNKQWSDRHKLIETLVRQEHIGYRNMDLDENCPNVIVVDSIEESRSGGQPKIQMEEVTNQLRTGLVAHFASHMPCVALKTGYSSRERSGNHMASGLSAAASCVASGISVLFLDCRERPAPPRASCRSQLLEAGKEHQASLTEWLRVSTEEPSDRPAASQTPGRALADYLDVMALAYFHSLCCGQFGIGAVRPRRRALHEVIAEAEHRKKNDSGPHELARASDAEMKSLIWWLGDHLFRTYFEVLRSPEPPSSPTAHREHYEQELKAWTMHAGALFTSPNFHSVNVGDLEVASDIMGMIVKKDRLPKANPLEGQKILRDCWVEYDIAMFMASRFKRYSKCLFALHLLMNVAVVVLAVIPALDCGPSRRRLQEAAHTAAVDDFLRECRATPVACSTGSAGRLWERLAAEEATRRLAEDRDRCAALGWSTFAISLCMAALISFLGFLNPVKRWRKLRSSACSLESFTWLYRTRVAAFEESMAAPLRPERALLAKLNAWRDFIVAGTDLGATSLQKVHPPTVFRHFQFQGILPEGSCGTGGQVAGGRAVEEGGGIRKTSMSSSLAALDHAGAEGLLDDYHSPTTPTEYVKLRLLPAMSFYQRRVPTYDRLRLLWMLLTLACTASSSVIAFMGELDYLPLAAALLSTATAWTEFADHSRKLERYSDSVRKLKQIESWWAHLGPVEQANRKHIETLVLETEATVAMEHTIWLSTGRGLDGKDEQGGDDDKDRATSKAAL